MFTPANFNGLDAAAVSPALQETSAPSQGRLPRKKGLSVTSLLIIVNTLIFCAMLAHWIYITGREEFLNTVVFAKFDSDLLRNWGSDFGPLTLTGQFWRVLTAGFLHFNFPHLAFNMLFLWGLGRPLGRFFTRAEMLGVYLLTGAAGSVWSLYWNPLRYSVGASGAIYGLCGVWIALLAFGRLRLPRRTVIGILVWLFFLTPIELLRGNMFKDTNYAAHAGGIVSGFVIGIFFALQLRLAEEERPIRLRPILRFAAMTLVVAFVAVTQLRRSAVMAYLNPEKPRSVVTTTFKRQGKPRISRVSLDLKGDPKMVRRFSAFLNFDLEDAEITVGPGGEDDAAVHAEIRGHAERQNLWFGMARMQITAKNDVANIDSCRAMSTGENTEFFDRSADAIAGEIREKYPQAKTMAIDPVSNMAASKQFAAEFPGELKKSGFTVVESAPADLLLRISLLRQKIAIDESMAAFDIKAVDRNGESLFRREGTGVLSAELAEDPPPACPDRFTDLGWLYSNDPLVTAARQLTESLRGPDAGPRVKHQAQSSK